MKSTPGLRKQLARAVYRVEDALIVLLLGAMILLAGAGIVLRDLFNTGISWSDPALRIMVLWIGLLGAMAAARDGSHIKIDILSHYLPQWALAVSRLLTDLFTAAVCATLSYYSASFVMEDKAAGASAVAGLPAWIFELILPIGFGVIALRYFLDSLVRLRQETERPQ